MSHLIRRKCSLPPFVLSLWPTASPPPLNELGPIKMQVVIFSTLFHKQLAVLRGHYSPIKDISWSDDGLCLVSVSDGEVYTWSMETFSK